jgi:hypothetical protein
MYSKKPILKRSLDKLDTKNKNFFGRKYYQ